MLADQAALRSTHSDDHSHESETGLSAGRRSLLVFGLAGQRFGIDVRQVREVVPRVALTWVPEAPPALVGLLRLRGRLLPVVDLRRRLGLPSLSPQLGQRIVVTLAGGTSLGLLVDAVHGVVEIDDLPNPAGRATPDRTIEQVIETAEGVITLLDAGAVVEPELGLFIAATVGQAE